MISLKQNFVETNEIYNECPLKHATLSFDVLLSSLKRNFMIFVNQTFTQSIKTSIYLFSEEFPNAFILQIQFILGKSVNIYYRYPILIV